MNKQSIETGKLLEEIWRYISKIKSSLESDNRFFTDSGFLTSLKRIFDECSVTLPAQTDLYRARIYNEEDKQEKRRGNSSGEKYEGYDEEGSFVNESNKWPTPGRMNPIGISVLYVASDVKTCIKELHPGVEELISVATIKTTKELKVADLSKGNSLSDNVHDSFLSVYVQELISQGYKERDYIFPQFVSSYCKSLEFDGIGYRSRYATRGQANEDAGVNYTFFNYNDRFDVTGSKLYEVTNIATTIRSIEEKVNGKRENP